jgi:putative restriction endonuclease
VSGRVNERPLVTVHAVRRHDRPPTFPHICSAALAGAFLPEPISAAFDDREGAVPSALLERGNHWTRSNVSDHHLTPDSPDVIVERARREALLGALRERADPKAAPPLLIKQLGIQVGQQGIYRDLQKTQHLAPSGVALSVRQTGSSYADDLTDDAVIYHYPRTTRPGRDGPEIDSLKAAQSLGLPVFVVVTLEDRSVRDVRVGWIVAHDDALGWALISFEPQATEASEGSPEAEFSLLEGRTPKKYLRNARTGQAKFKFDVFARYGASCAACGLDEVQLLEAAHLCPVSANGANDPRNGLVLCANHHKALDLGLLRIKPDTREFIHGDGQTAGLGRLGVTVTSLGALRNRPHQDALQWLWDGFARG